MMHRLGCLLVAMVAVGACGGASKDVANETEAGVSSPDTSLQPPACAWPSPIDAGPGACRVGRFYLQCDFPSGGSCDSGLGFGPNMSMLCVSDDPTGCTGCHATAGTPTCESKCPPNQYVMACGGPPRLSLDGGFDDDYYQQAPDACTMVAPTPSGVGYWCCPCQ